MAGDYALTDDLADAALARPFPFSGEAASQAVRLPGHIVVHRLESERLEPTRGSWAHVSQIVMAVDDHRVVPIEAGGRLGAKLLERDVDRPGQVLLGVLLLRQDLNQLRPLFEQFA